MKKLLGIITIGVAVIGFSACGGDDEEDVVATSAVVLATEAAVTEAGQTLDVDCAIKTYAKMSEADTAIMLENVDKFSDPEADPTSIGLSEEGVNILMEVIGCISE